MLITAKLHVCCIAIRGIWPGVLHALMTMLPAGLRPLDNAGFRRIDSSPSMRKAPLTIGEPAPWFVCRTGTRERFEFNVAGGRYVVLSFIRSASEPHAADYLARIRANRERFDDGHACFFAVSVDPDDETQGRLSDLIPGIRVFWDFDRAVSEQYGAIDPDGNYRCRTYVLDPTLRVVAILSVPSSAEKLANALFEILDRCPRFPPPHLVMPQAPVLVLPNVFEIGLCDALMAYYEREGGRESGFMRELNGRTTVQFDNDHKRRRDCIIEDGELARACMTRVSDRIVPEMAKAFQFRATCIERYIVACYDAQDEGHFQPHRDNTTKGTAHRRFAVSVFLNSGQYEGGYLRFPEFGSGLFTAPRGGAVVFSCSLMHEATRVTQGRRFMFLPFLYDDAARSIRQQNEIFVDL
jgi:peroxiredoxin/predicted 2-oxoglutarate/Fe(II)-dependent dioxygenase YbiX